MARGRMLNKSVCSSLKFHELPDDTCRLLATWIIAHLDHNGVFYADPVMVRSHAFPRRPDVDLEQIGVALEAMQKVGLIVLFKAKGERWQHWPGFAANQVGLRADRETSEYPQPPRQDAGKMPDDCRKESASMSAEGKLSEENISKDAGKGLPAPSDNLTTGQRYFLSSFGAKRFKTRIQREAVGALEEKYGSDTLNECIDWAAKRGMNMGSAVVSIEKAIKKWGDNGKAVLR